MRIQLVLYVVVLCRLQIGVYQREVGECLYPHHPVPGLVSCAVFLGCASNGQTVWQPVRISMYLWGMGSGDQIRAKHTRH